MKVTTNYETNLESVQFGYFEGDEFKELNTEEQINEFLKRKDWKKELIECIAFFKDQIKDNIIMDMIDLQKQIDELKEGRE